MPSFFFHVIIDLNSRAQPSDYGLTLASELFTNRLERKSQNLQPVATQLRLVPQHSEPVNRKDVAHQLELFDKTTADESGQNGILTKKLTNVPYSEHPSDWRYGRIIMQGTDMVPSTQKEDDTRIKASNGQFYSGIGAGSGGLATKGKFEPTELDEEELGWGILRLYRDAEETQGLYSDISASKGSKATRSNPLKQDQLRDVQSFKDEDCTTLCILAVPSYLTPSDFLGFVGERTRDEVSHFRMIRTERSNRYMVIMKFRSGRRAREWRKEWNGKIFNDMDSESCHVVFIRSIEFRDTRTTNEGSSFHNMPNDTSITPQTVKEPSTKTQAVSPSPASLNSKPMAPPTPALVELPTCPVCLERMDESTGLLTIQCQHVFHCSCLQNWRGSGCPVCRYTQEDMGKRYQNADPDSNLNECNICRSDVNLWICLICGSVGCGRYDAAHAFLHYQQTSHCFAMDLTTQRVWDYASDGYVHRIMQSKTDGKLMELPSAVNNYDNGYTDNDSISRDKLDSITLEYTHLLTSQLESQRLYFEEKVERAADKASQAAQAAISATETSSKTASQLSSLQLAHEELIQKTIPTLEKDRDRSARRAEKFEGMARKLEKEWREEKALSGSLMERIEFLNAEAKKLKESNADLQEQNRDMSFFISGTEKLKDLGEEVQEGTVSLPEQSAGKKKGKGKKIGG